MSHHTARDTQTRIPDPIARDMAVITATGPGYWTSGIWSASAKLSTARSLFSIW